MNIGISPENRKAVCNLLNMLLADEYVIYTKTRNYHWNVTGRNFMEMHKFFEAQYKELDEVVDEVAERIRTLGHLAEGSLQEMLTLTRLQENTDEEISASLMIEHLLHDHETIVRLIRQDLETCADLNKDLGTSDFLTGLMQRHEKMAWMLRCYL